MKMNNESETKYLKTGYLLEHFKLFHLRDLSNRDFFWHYHDFHKIVWFVEGAAAYHIEGKTFRLSPYDMLLVKKGEIHKPEVEFSCPYERYVIYISPQFLEACSLKGDSLSRCFTEREEAQENLIRLPALESNYLMSVIKRLEQVLQEKRYAGKQLSDIVFLDFMIHLNRICVESPDIFKENARYDKKIVEIMHYINTHLEQDMTVDFLAERYYISKYHLMRKFKEETGYSIHQYILEKRMIMAKDMLVKGAPASAAALDCGFKDYSTFHRVFKKKMNVSPSEYVNLQVSRKNT